MAIPNQVSAIVKRLADAFEKFAVASFAIGVYQESKIAVAIGLAFTIACLVLTWRVSK